MPNKAPASAGYRTPSRLLHWVTALLVLATIPAGLTMIQEGLSRPLQDTLFIFHKNTGVVLLLLVLARLAVRLVSPPPPLPMSVPPWQRRAAALSHAVLYLLLLVMAVSGYVRVRAGGFPIEGLDALGAPRLVPRSKPVEAAAKATHATTILLLIPLILLHVAAAAQHALWRRDGVFGRMWPPWRRRIRGQPGA